MTAQATAPSFDLDERYDTISGRVLMTGIQALVRAINDQAQLDHWRDINSGGFVSGYRGSPLGGLDKELWRVEARLTDRRIKFQPGVNEDLAATAVWGSQQVGLHAGNQVEGVYGFWYGKAPGLDRSCDAIRHANAWGTSPNGGVLCVVGDDPAAKSSSLATQSEFTFQDLGMPILAPSNVQEVRDYALLGWQMSRQAGCWVGLKAIADHMDSAGMVDVSLKPFKSFERVAASEAHIRREDSPQDQERRLLGTKLPAVIEFARSCGINQRVTSVHGQARLGIICAGKAYADVRESLSLINLKSLEDVSDAGIEILKLGMTWPMEADLIEQFAARCDRILVVEEKRAFVETQVREVLYNGTPKPIAGKKDFSGHALIPQTGILEPVQIARWLSKTLDRSINVGTQSTELSVAEVNAPARKERTPLFCAGCPHNRSTRVPEGSRATAGIGCHYMVQWMDRDTDSCSHMGGEGVTWLGEAPFTSERHIFANLGDGTYFHSGLLAIRQAQAAGVNITYKILFNEAVAMTGGQPMDGELTVAAIVDQVRAEGVQNIRVVSANPELHSNLDVPVSPREDLDDVQNEMREIEGVSVLIYQQTCATELRRQRKRGLVEDKKTRLFINQDACEGCGDCAVVSNCVAVEPVSTMWGSKRQINQTLCNKDDSCAEGFCPAIVRVEPGQTTSTAQVLPEQMLQRAMALPEPSKPQSSSLLITGVGGTGIVTLSALLAAAAKVDGRSVKTLDMTGLAQKGGAVFSHVRIGGAGQIFTPRIPAASADALIACDLVAAASSEAVSLLNSDTRAIVNSHVLPTAETWDPAKVRSFDPHSARVKRLKTASGHVQTFNVERFATELFGNALQANVLLLGVSYQAGLLPLSLQAIVAAIEANGVQVKENVAAFQLGRLLHDEPEISLGSEARHVEPLTIEQARNHLMAYRGTDEIEDFDQMVDRIRTLEQNIRPQSETLTRIVALQYLRALAPKDEYEIGRLYSSDKFAQSLSDTFGEGAEVSYLLAPPLLGQKKRAFGKWMQPVMGMLGRCRTIRGRWFDPFRYSAEADLSRDALATYTDWLEHILKYAHPGNMPSVIELASLFAEVKGFGHVKAERLEAQKRRAQELKTQLALEVYDAVNIVA